MDFTTYEPRIYALEAGGGGGGDNDFSIARVTIVNNGESDDSWVACCAVENEDGKGALTSLFVDLGTTDVNIIMYGGYSIINAQDSNYTRDDITTSGGVTANFDRRTNKLRGFSVTGDGTITIG